MIPVDKSPGADLKERIKKTVTSCKATIEDHFKKGTFYQFLEALISHIVTAMTGDMKAEEIGRASCRERV